MLPAINQRVKDVIDCYTNGTISAFADKLGAISQQTVNRIFHIDKRTGKYPVPTTDILVAITNMFVDVNPRWLLTGSGSMFLEDNTPNLDRIKSVVNEQKYTNNVHPTLGKTVHPTVHPTPINDEATLIKGNIIMIDLKAAAGLPGNLLEPYYYKDFPSFSLPGANYRFGRFLCVQINGDSMHPTIKHNEWLIAEEKETLSDIKSGHIYLVITKDAVLCKRLYYNPRATFIELHSDNDDVYPVEKISITDVQKIYKGTDKLTNDFRNYNSDIRKDVANIKEQISDLWKVIKSQSK